MDFKNLGLWIALGTGVGAAFGAAGVLGMGEAVAWGVAAGFITGRLIITGGRLCA